ncbi:cystatin-like [Engraulis encrasicolus]|uniref:cystatin-like n=1 Tax=Engraulis encrasicolus TaxID=184585 RepID=UPI002FD68F32
MWKTLLLILPAAFALSNAAMVGGPADADINEEGVQNALQYAVVEHNKGTNDMYISKVANVVKVQKQVVAGMKYIFTVEMGRTPCKKGGVELNCEVHTDLELAKPYTCTFEVWSRPWVKVNGIKLVKNQCMHPTPAPPKEAQPAPVA